MSITDSKGEYCTTRQVRYEMVSHMGAFMIWVHSELPFRFEMVYSIYDIDLEYYRGRLQTDWRIP